ncbi:MAG TPA: glycosyltransferase family 39 protein [Polyangiales bacterium]|nr:glycosyltransferase family 39 protein [Polyangiales bacterium]
MSKLKTYGLLFALTVLTRLDTYALSDIEFDESVYFLMARAMTQGHAPYTAIWDHKPPGIYGVYYVAITLLGQSAFAVRVFATLAIALSGWLAIQLHQRLRPGARYAWVPGVLVVLMFRKYGGQGANNELFFVPAAAGSILLLLTAVQNQGARRPLQLLGAGALAGIAFWIKFNVVLEIQAAGAFAVLLLADKHPARMRRIGEEVIYAAIGFLIVAALVITPFALADLLGLFRYSTIEANVRHVGNRMTPLESFAFLLKVLEESMAQWALVVAGVVFHLRKDRDPILARQYTFVAAWLLGALASALAPGQPYDHYALEMAVPLCLAAWLTFEDVFLPHLQGRAAVAALSFLILGSTGTSLFQVPLNVGRELASLIKRRSLESIDTSRWVTNYIREHTRGDDVTLYVMDGQPLLYHLLEVDPPTRYAFPPFLLDPHFEHVTGSEAKPEVARILAEKPEWIVRRVDPFKESLMMREHIAELIAHDYTLETTIHNLDVLHRVVQ